MAGSVVAVASEGDADSVAIIHSALNDASHLIPHVESPITVFRNQLGFDPKQKEYSCEHPHSGYLRHLIPIDNLAISKMKDDLGKYLKPSIINGIKIPEVYL